MALDVNRLDCLLTSTKTLSPGKVPTKNLSRGSLSTYFAAIITIMMTELNACKFLTKGLSSCEEE